MLTGGSTGGWIALASQVHHPTFYGGSWTCNPDSVDFRRYQLIDIYEDANAFLVPNAVPGAPERMFQRTSEGQPVGSVRQLSQLERAQGSRGRSGGQIDAWNAAYGPTGEDGYPWQDFLEATTDPNYGGQFVHGRPMKGHGWSPFTNAELVRGMADHVARNAPAEASKAWYAGGS